MSENQKEISKLEQDATSLVQNLRELHDQVGSYKTAKNSLEETNNKLSYFIESTHKLAEESHQIIEVINKIGSGKIFRRLDVIEKGVKRNFIILVIGFLIIFVLQIIFFVL